MDTNFDFTEMRQHSAADFEKVHTIFLDTSSTFENQTEQHIGQNWLEECMIRIQTHDLGIVTTG